MSAKVLLEVLAGPIKGRVFEFDQHDTFIFGRASDCHAHLAKDGYVSRHHFLLEANPPEATIRDLGSLNGTHVNGVRYGGRKAAKQRPGAFLQDCQVPLRDGDRIGVGQTTILVRVEMPSVDEPPGAPLGAAAQRDPGERLYTPTSTESAMPEQPSVSEWQQFAPPGLAPAAMNAPAGVPQTASEADQKGGVRHLIQQAVDQYQSSIPLEIQGYKLEEVLGQGAMGTVYRAMRLADDFPVAIKVMLPKVAAKEKARRRFLREIDVIRELNHPNIATLIDSGVVGKAFYFVLDFCNGGCLAALAARRGGKLPLSALRPIMLQSLAGLEHAHQRGFVHRDLKPGNILLHQQGTGWVAKIGDFGLAKQFEQAGFSGMTLTGSRGGTYDYMPREQLIDFKTTKPVSDVWSLGATFYRVLTGVSPRECAEGRDAMEVVLGEKAVPVRQRDPSIPPAVAAILDKSLAMAPKDRFQNASDMRRAFEEVSAW